MADLERWPNNVRLLFAGCAGALVGLLQLLLMLAIEVRGTGPSGIDGSDFAFPIFACLVLVEIISVVALSMYRVAPWILRLLRSDWAERKVREGKAANAEWLARLVVAAALLRRIVVMVDARTWSWDLVFSLAVAMGCLLVPAPKGKKLNQTPGSTRLAGGSL